MKKNCAGHILVRKLKTIGKIQTGLQPGKHSVGRLLTRWTDDFKIVAGRLGSDG